jgi:peptidylprolyl isomerase
VKLTMLILSICAAIALAACGDDDSSTTTESAPQNLETKPKVEVPEGDPPKELVTEDLVEGDGDTAESGDEVTVEYVGVDYKTGKEFDASWGREPFTFQLGAEEVIKGWDKGVEGMAVGGRRELIVPPNLAYGSLGAPPAIEPNATLVFVVDLVDVK